MPQALMADRLGIDPAAFNAWLTRLGAARDYIEPPESAANILRKLCPDRRQREQESRVIAERMFEGN